VFWSLPGGKLATPTRSMVTLNRARGAFHVTGVTTGDPKLLAKLETVRQGLEYRVTLTYAGGWKPGVVKRTLTVRTDDLKQREIKVPIQAVVQASTAALALAGDQNLGTRGFFERRTMMSRTFILAWLLAGVSTFALVGTGAQQRSPSILDDVPGLDRPVTYTETKIPLGELVHTVAIDTGVSLAAVKEVADEPVAVVGREMPARRLLEELAELLDYQWTRRRGDADG